MTVGMENLVDWPAMEGKGRTGRAPKRFPMAHLSILPLSLLQISTAFSNFSVSLILFLCTFTGSTCSSIHHNGCQSSAPLSLPQSVWRTHSSYHLYGKTIHIYIPQAKSPKVSTSTGSPTTLQLSTSNIKTCLCPQTSPLPSMAFLSLLPLFI